MSRMHLDSAQGKLELSCVVDPLSSEKSVQRLRYAAKAKLLLFFAFIVFLVFTKPRDLPLLTQLILSKAKHTPNMINSVLLRNVLFDVFHLSMLALHVYHEVVFL